MRSARRLALTGALVSCLALTACGSGSDEPAASPAPSALPSAPKATFGAPVPSASSSPAAGAAAPVGDVTKAGTKLKVGEKALFPFSAKDLDTAALVTGTLGVTVTRIEQGAEADLAPLKLGDKAKGFTPFYIRVTVTNESGSAFPFASFPGPAGRLVDGSPAQRVSIFGAFAPCPNKTAPKDFTTKGASFETCAVALANAGTTVTGAQSSGPLAKVEGAPDYSREPVVWS